MTRKSHITLLALLAVALFTAGCNHYDNPTEEQTTPISANISIAELRQRAEKRALSIDQELIIGG